MARWPDVLSFAGLAFHCLHTINQGYKIVPLDSDKQRTSTKMNTRTRAERNNVSSSPPDEIKAQLGDSGRTMKTSSMSETSLNDNDSVVSEITLDPAFRQTKSAPFEKTVIVQRSQHHARKSLTRQLPQKTVSKLDGNDFLDGKFKSAFRKEISEGLIQQGQETSLKQTLMEKKLATEYANRKKEMSNAKLDDLPENSLMEMFISVNLAVEVPDHVKTEEQRQRRHRSFEIKKRHEKDSHRASREITFDPKDVQGKKQRRRHSKKETHDDSRDIVFDPTESSDLNESNASTFVPPPPLAALEDAANGNQDQTPKLDLHDLEITVLPEELMAIPENSATNEPQEKQRRRSPNYERRSSKPSKNVPVFKRRLPFEDVPLSITIDDDNTLVSEIYFPGLANIEEEEQIEAEQENEQSPCRRHSTSTGRPSRKTDHIDSSRKKRRHSTERSSRQKSPRRKSHHTESSRRRRHSTSEREGSKPRNIRSKHRSSSRHRSSSADNIDNKNSSSHHSKRRSSHHECKPSKDESTSHPSIENKDAIKDASTDTIDEMSGGKEGIKITSVHEEQSEDHISIDNKSDPVAIDPKEDNKPSEEMVEILREPLKMRRTFSAPELASLTSQCTQDEEGISSLSEELQKRHTPTSATMTPRRKSLWKRISKRPMRPISALSNERCDTSLWSLRKPQSPGKQSLTDSGGSFSKRSMLSSSSSDLGSSKGGSERSLRSPPTIQSQPSTGSQVIAPKARKHYTPTVVRDSSLSLSYSELVMQGKIGMSIPEGRTLQ